jgi:hypothetical protein
LAVGERFFHVNANKDIATFVPVLQQSSSVRDDIHHRSSITQSLNITNVVIAFAKMEGTKT